MLRALIEVKPTGRKRRFQMTAHYTSQTSVQYNRVKLARPNVTSFVAALLRLAPQSKRIQAWRQALAYKLALQQTYARFAEQHPLWVETYFDLAFLNGAAAPILARYVEQGIPANPTELICLWDQQLGPASLEVRQHRSQKITPAVTEFLRWLESALDQVTYS
jgi:hypothetical protein